MSHSVLSRATNTIPPQSSLCLPPPFLIPMKLSLIGALALALLVTGVASAATTGRAAASPTATGASAATAGWYYQMTYLHPTSGVEGCASYQAAVMVSGFYTNNCQPTACRAVSPSFFATAANNNSTNSTNSINSTSAAAAGDSFTFTFVDVDTNATAATQGGVQSWWWAETVCQSGNGVVTQASLIVSEYQTPGGCPPAGAVGFPNFITQYTKGCIAGPVSPSLNSYQAYCDNQEYYVIGYSDDQCTSATYTVLQHQQVGCLPYFGPHPYVHFIENTCVSPGTPGTPGDASIIDSSLPRSLFFAAIAVIFAIGVII